MSTKTPTTARFRKGDKVWVPLALGRVRGTVIDNRGPWGLAGRDLYRVAVPNDPYEADEFILGEDELEPLDEDAERAEHDQLAADAVIEFLVNGGLVAILQQNSPEAVWLRRDAHGTLTFTFVEGYSATGGHASPRYALHGEAVFTPKADEVVRFIESFGLSEQQAREVIARVGTRP